MNQKVSSGYPYLVYRLQIASAKKSCHFRAFRIFSLLSKIVIHVVQRGYTITHTTNHKETPSENYFLSIIL
jgi:hypothetical protein